MLIVSADARGDSPPSVDLRGYRIPLDANAGMYLETPYTGETGDITAGARLNYGYRPVVLHDANGDVKYAVIQNQLTADLFGTVALFGSLAVGFDLPAVIAQGGDDFSQDTIATGLLGTSRLPKNAIGDPGIDLKATLYRSSKVPNRGVAFGMLDRFTLPLGDPASYLGEGTVTNEARALFDGHFLSAFTVRGNLGAKFRGDEASFACGDTPDASCKSRFGDELNWGAGLALDTKLLKVPNMTWFGEVRGYLPLAPIHPFQSALPSGTFASLAASYAVHDVHLFAGVEVALDSGVGNAPLRVSIGVTFAPRNHDRDGDGIPDDVDKCPDIAEDFDGFEDEDGCPEVNGPLPVKKDQTPASSDGPSCDK